MTARSNIRKGMTQRQARTIEGTIIGICLVALAFVFQPFSQILFSVGTALCVVGGLAFNLVPFCVPGKPLKSVLKAGAIVAVIFGVVILIALGVTEIYISSF